MPSTFRQFRNTTHVHYCEYPTRTLCSQACTRMTPPYCEGTPLCIPTQRAPPESPKPWDQWSKEALTSLPLLPCVSFPLLFVHLPLTGISIRQYQEQVTCLLVTTGKGTGWPHGYGDWSQGSSEKHQSFMRTSWQRTGKRQKEKTIPEAGAELCKPAGSHTTKQASKALSCKAKPESRALLAHGFWSSQKIPAKALNLLCIR